MTKLSLANVFEIKPKIALFFLFVLFIIILFCTSFIFVLSVNSSTTTNTMFQLAVVPENRDVCMYVTRNVYIKLVNELIKNILKFHVWKSPHLPFLLTAVNWKGHFFI